MKSLLIIASVALSLTASAITFITEDDVQKVLEADKVIEVSSLKIAPLMKDNPECLEKVDSKSSRAYIVKTGYVSELYITDGQLKNLVKCGEL